MCLLYFDNHKSGVPFDSVKYFLQELHIIPAAFIFGLIFADI